MNKNEKYTEAEFNEKVASGYFRKKYGLDTSSGSSYHRLRQEGLSDFEAQKIEFGRFKQK